MAVSLEILDVSKVFQKDGDLVRAVDRVSIVASPGEMVTFLGPSGCGKTTTLRMVAGFETPSEGSIVIGGRDVTDVPVNRRDIGFVFQSYALFPHMSVFENVAYGLRVNGVGDNAFIARQVEKSLKQAALWNEVKDRLHSNALGLSGGQQQRLCIARALSVEPEILLMDEPASALDPIATQKIEELIHELKQHLTIIIVTHSMQQAARVSDMTAFFYMGKLIEMDQTETIFTRPSNKQTEDYITGRFG